MPSVQLSSGKVFESLGDVSLLDAAATSGVSLPYSCKTGRCSTCKCRVISGETKALVAELGLTDSDRQGGWILTCARSALTDLVLEVEDLGGKTLPAVKTLACRISSVETLAPDVVKVILRLPPSATFDFIPGQYIEVIGPGGVRRSYSVANSPRTDKTIELHIRAVAGGAMSHYWFNQAQANDLLRICGPLGTFFIRNAAGRDVFFLATGTGIAPVKAMLESFPSLPADQMPKSVTVLWGGRYMHDLYIDFSAIPGVYRFIPVLSREATWQGECGHIQDVLLRHKPDLKNCLVYACGSDVMIRSAKIVLTAAGLDSQGFYSDAFVCSGIAGP
jgi:CDP-4-dehydro-6-deoxyglucose reductase